MNRKTVVAVSLLMVLAVAIAYVVLQSGLLRSVHDVAVTSVTVSSTQLYLGDTLNITITAKNRGTVPETFSITSYRNTTEIGTDTVTSLAPNSEIDLTFGWDLSSGALLANYIIKADASIVTGESNTTDNSYVFGVVRVRQKPGLRAILFVDPQNVTAGVGEDFSIRVNATDVVDLVGWELRLSWNATVLEVSSLVEGSFLKDNGSTFFVPTVNNTAGRLVADCTLLGDRPGVSGNGTLTIIRFHVNESGLCILNLFDTVLLSSLEERIVHTATSGQFSG